MAPFCLPTVLQRLPEHKFLFFTLAVTALCFPDFYGYEPVLGNWIRDAGIQTAAVCATVALDNCATGHVLWAPF